MTLIRDSDDIRAVERMGLDRACPHRTPGAIIETASQHWPDRAAIRYVRDTVDPAGDVVVTYAELWARVRAAGQVFRDLGVGPGRAVGILGTHTPSVQIALWGAQLAGCACPINPMLRPEHIATLLNASNAAAIVAMGPGPDRDLWPRLVPALRAAGVSLPVLDCDSVTPAGGSDGAFEDLVARAMANPVTVPVAGDPHATAALYHTGGTTGAPKLVHQSRLNQAHVARCCALFHAHGPGDVVLNGFPLFHVAGAFVYGLSVLSSGATMLIPGPLGMRNRDFMGTLWHQVEQRGITVLGAVPTILAGLMSHPVDADIASLKIALSGGSPLPPELADGFERMTSVPVRNVFGMTETSGTIALEPLGAPRVALSCGFPLPFMEVAILMPDAPDPARPMAVGETGVIAVRGPNVSTGYTEASRNTGVFLDGGWLVTGDLGRMDETGRLFITGRAKDVIIRGSHNIDPQSIEDALLAHAEIETAAAIGMPDSYAGELPVAFVTLRAGATLDEAAILGFLADRIEEPAAMPKRVEIIGEMPVTPVGKIFKPHLRGQAIRWAVAAAAAGAGIAEDQYRLEVSETLDVSVHAGPEQAEKIREACLGMPIEIAFPS